MIIGIYKIWSMFSYIGLLFGVISIYFSRTNNVKLSLLFLMFASLIDIFDGTIARKFKRTEKEKQFGIEIDSILDTINFGVIPIIIYLNMGYSSWYNYIISFLYLSVITMRLAYFNTDLVNLKGINKNYEIYYGFPVTTIPMFLILGFLICSITKLKLIMPLTMIISMILFITKIKIKRYKNKWFNIILIIIGLSLIALMFGVVK